MAASLLYNREPRWQISRIARKQAATKLQPWLLGRGSLTSDLRKASNNDVQVKILSQTVTSAYPSETRLLGLKPRQRALIREVILCGGGQPWVFARSVLPLSTLTGRLRALRKLDDRPLGHHLFSYTSMHRGPIDIARVHNQHRYLPRAYQTHGQALWGRRSLFYLDAKPLLVSEVFLNSFSPNGHFITQG